MTQKNLYKIVPVTAHELREVYSKNPPRMVAIAEKYVPLLVDRIGDVSLQILDDDTALPGDFSGAVMLAAGIVFGQIYHQASHAEGKDGFEINLETLNGILIDGIHFGAPLGCPEAHKEAY